MLNFSTCLVLLLAAGPVLPRRWCLSCGQTPAESSSCLSAGVRRWHQGTGGDGLCPSAHTSLAAAWPEPSSPFSSSHIAPQSSSCTPVCCHQFRREQGQSTVLALENTADKQASVKLVSRKDLIWPSLGN